MNKPIPALAFGGRMVGAGHPVVVIAEIGINHEGSVETCARMIEAAAAAGADAIKLQTIDPDENYVVGTESHELFSRAVLSREDTAAMFRLSRDLGMEPFTTAGDRPTIDWVDRLNPAAHKISSGLLTNVPIVRYAARTSRMLVMSTGMAETSDIDEAVATAKGAGTSGICILQCTSIYPCDDVNLNLATIGWLADRYECASGFSDHSLGDLAATLSVAAGARMIEKHMTLDSSRAGYDHHLSLEPHGFAELVRRVRRAEQIMGTREKVLTDQERGAAARFHRILVARRDIKPGEVLDEDNVGTKRPLPGTSGMQPNQLEVVLGSVADRAFRKDEPIVIDTTGAPA